MKGGHLHKYSTFFWIAIRSQAYERALLAGKVIFLIMILFIFYNLWEAVFESGLPTGASSTQMLWYLVTTEWILMSVPYLHLEIEADLRSGDIGSFLLRPVSYLGMQLAQGVGALLPRLVLLGSLGAIFTYFLTGTFIQSPSTVLALLMLGPLAAMVQLLFIICIGLTALWIQKTAPCYWVWQKALFILGGLMLPISIYPQWLQNLASLTPFYAILYGPAHLVLEFSWGEALNCLLLLLLWGNVALFLVQALFRLTLKNLTLNAG